MTDKKLIVFTDGAALGNPGRGGYGIVLKWGSARKEISEAFELTTNNRMELMAVIVALETLKKEKLNIHIYTDSKYVCDAIDKKWVWGWQKKGWKDKKNIDLWKRFILLYDQHIVSMHWVKGHAGIEENEVCDVLATTAAKNGPWKKDFGYKQENNVSLI
ncbi:MAG: ribonuclease HI [Bacteroidetes bacterium]|nr:ribonuclease HI [Bacteroidota bacterium]